MVCKRILMLSILLAVQACGSKPITQAEYWMGQGERFGANGYSYQNDIIESLKLKVPFDEQAYKEGYEIGKKDYCDPFKAFEKGVQGVKYTGQCKGQAQEVMVKAEWQRGWDAFIGADFYKFR